MDAAALQERLRRWRAQEAELRWTGTFWEYFDRVRENPRLARLSHARVYDLIADAGVEEGPDGPRYRFFTDELFGLERTLSQLVDYFHSAARRLEVRKRILLLMGPVGGGKSTLVTLLKRGLESYSRTPQGALYTIVGCPMHEEPLHLIPGPLRGELAAEYALYIEGDLCPVCQHRLETEWGGDIDQVPVERLALDEKHRVGIGTFAPSDPKSQDIAELTGSIDLATVGEYGSESDPRAYRFDGELNIANRGLMEFIELLKSDEKFLYGLLTLSQEQVLINPSDRTPRDRGEGRGPLRGHRSQDGDPNGTGRGQRSPGLMTGRDPRVGSRPIPRAHRRVGREEARLNQCPVVHPLDCGHQGVRQGPGDARTGHIQQRIGDAAFQGRRRPRNGARPSGWRRRGMGLQTDHLLATYAGGPRPVPGAAGSHDLPRGQGTRGGGPTAPLKADGRRPGDKACAPETPGTGTAANADEACSGVARDREGRHQAAQAHDRKKRELEGNQTPRGKNADAIVFLEAINERQVRLPPIPGPGSGDAQGIAVARQQRHVHMVPPPQGAQSHLGVFTVRNHANAIAGGEVSKVLCRPIPQRIVRGGHEHQSSLASDMDAPQAGAEHVGDRGEKQFPRHDAVEIPRARDGADAEMPSLAVPEQRIGRIGKRDAAMIVKRESDRERGGVAGNPGGQRGEHHRMGGTERVPQGLPLRVTRLGHRRGL